MEMINPAINQRNSERWIDSSLSEFRNYELMEIIKGLMALSTWIQSCINARVSGSHVKIHDLIMK